MSFSYRYRTPISLVALTALVVASFVTPARAEYDPHTGRFLQRDPNGQALVLQPGLLYHGASPTVTVSLAYELQYADGMNFYEFVRSNPVILTDPAGLFAFFDLSGAQSLQGDLMGTQLDVGASVVDAMKGLIFLANERNAEMDSILGLQSDLFDSSGIDTALAMYDQFQQARVGLFVGGIGTGLIKAGKAIWGKFVGRAGGRGRLLARLDDGIDSRRSAFGFQSRFWTRRTTFNGKRVYQRDDLINPHFVGPDGRTNLQRMRDGNAPLTDDAKPVLLHHMIQTDDSPIAEITFGFNIKHFKTIHINPNTIRSGIQRRPFDSWRRAYWKYRAADFK